MQRLKDQQLIEFIESGAEYDPALVPWNLFAEEKGRWFWIANDHRRLRKRLAKSQHCPIRAPIGGVRNADDNEVRAASDSIIVKYRAVFQQLAR